MRTRFESALGGFQRAGTEFGLFLKDRGRYEEAGRVFRMLAASCPDPGWRAGHFLRLGQVKEYLGRFEEAADAYRRALMLEPTDRELWYFIHNNLGYSLVQLGRHEQAEPVLRDALNIDPDRANAYKNLGLARCGLGDVAGAAHLFIEATRRVPTDPRSLAHLEELVETHPELRLEIPHILCEIEECRRLVEVATRKPDIAAS
jgi:tetratricopeptide (TPR) repeat protein